MAARPGPHGCVSPLISSGSRQAFQLAVFTSRHQKKGHDHKHAKVKNDDRSPIGLRLITDSLHQTIFVQLSGCGYRRQAGRLVGWLFVRNCRGLAHLVKPACQVPASVSVNIGQIELRLFQMLLEVGDPIMEGLIRCA